MNKGNQKLYLPEQSRLKQKLENKIKAKCQLGNKALKIKPDIEERRELKKE